MAAKQPRRVPVTAPHTLSSADVLTHFSVTQEQGLSASQVAEQLAQFGENSLEEQEQKSLLELVLQQFEDLLVRILLLSAFISFLLAYFEGDAEGWTAYVEPLVILLILIANAFVGVWQESNAEAALDALKKLQPQTAMVLRDGTWGNINATELVPGDIVEVKVGDKVPADLRMLKLKTTTIRIEQSQLTGESQSVAKDVDPLSDPNLEIQGKTNMLFASTTVSNGACICSVVATGMVTEIGKIQESVQKAAEDEEQTPLQKKLD